VKTISGKRMCRVLEERGWTLARINGSHYIYRHTENNRQMLGERINVIRLSVFFCERQSSPASTAEGPSNPESV